ncbi:MAG TPA: ATP-binding protein [Pirellulales bacterium]|nr:ATP-binding protein [Pirellulales bacterium]
MRTLRQKILLGYFVALGFAAAALGLAVANLVRLGDASDAILRENYRSILAAEEMLGALDQQENGSLLLMLEIDPKAASQLSKADQSFSKWLERAKDNITIEGESEILSQIERSYADFLDKRARLGQIGLQDRERGAEYYREQFAPQAAAVRRACRELHDLNRLTMEASSRRAQSVGQTAVWSALVGGLLSFAGIVAFSVWSSNRLVRPIDRLARLTELVAAGDYSVNMDQASRDEIGRLAEKFNAMIAQLRDYHDLNLRRIVGEQQKAEAILEAIDDGVAVVAADGAVASLNPAAARILRVSRDAAVGRSQTEVIPDNELRDQIARTLAAGRPPKTPPGGNSLTIAGEGSTPRYYDWALTPISSSEHGASGVILLLRDVTTLKTLDQLKTEFVMIASHELRSPLTSISMSIGLLEERVKDQLGEDERRLLDVAQEELERLRKLVNELLDLSKIESGELVIEAAPTPVGPFVEAAVAPFRPQAEKQGIDLTVKMEDGIPPVRADANKIAWVVGNLLSNALRYARHEISVSAERAGRWVNLYVRDDGPGIPHEQQARIFDKFVQVEGDARGGAGLGLAICKEIVRAHRGNIWIESEPGRGSLVIVALPISGANAELSFHVGT